MNNLSNKNKNNYYNNINNNNNISNNNIFNNNTNFNYKNNYSKSKKYNEETLNCENCNKAFSLDNIQEYYNHVNSLDCNNINNLNYNNNINNNCNNSVSQISDLYSEDNNQSNRNINFSISNSDNSESYSVTSSEDDLDDITLSVVDDSNILNENELNKLEETKHIFNANLDNKCFICLNEICSNEKIIRLPCMHFYHSQEIKKWLRKKVYCPICRTNIKEILK